MQGLRLLAKEDDKMSFQFPKRPNVPLLRAFWSLLDGIWGLLKGSWGVLVQPGPFFAESQPNAAAGSFIMGFLQSQGTYFPNRNLRDLGLTRAPRNDCCHSINPFEHQRMLLSIHTLSRRTTPQMILCLLNRL